MCVADDKEAHLLGPATPLATARDVLARLAVEAHPAVELEVSVLRSLELLFPDGLPDQIRDSILGWLGAKAASKEPGRRFFTAIDLLGEMGARAACANLASGAMDEWRSLWNELPKIFDDRVRMRLGRAGESVTAALAQPAASLELTKMAAGLCLLFGKAGAGKTSLLAQVAQQERETGTEVFCTLADAADEGNLENIIRSLRFRRALLALRTPERKLWIGVDGLDEVDASLRVRWAKQLKRLALDAQTVVVTTVREAIWKSDADLRRHLAARHSLLVDDWPEDLVRSLLASTPLSDAVSPTLFALLRQPLFLDLFWRAFVEQPPRLSRSLARSVETRHGLLTAFWKERVSESTRHNVPNFALRLDEIIRSAAGSIGSFPPFILDKEAMTVLVGESVLILEGSLNPRYRFRHPLLRDFVFALWCLRGGDAEGVFGRWQTIKGGLQRQGALRAIFEAIIEAGEASEFPEVSINELLTAFCGNHSSATHIAQLLGTLTPTPALDPAWWSVRTLNLLPASFGRELLVSARLAANFGWADYVVHWAAHASWLDADFPREVLSYTDALHRQTKVDVTNPSLAQLARQAARTLRAFSEHPRYEKEFSEIDRWLKSMSFSHVIPLLPDFETLEWIEREMTAGSWRTRGFLLEHLIHLAGVDAARTAAIYRRSVGLVGARLEVTMDAQKWNSIMDHQAIEWSLAGADGHRSLLAEYPREFLPVALDLVVALTPAISEGAPDNENAKLLIADFAGWDDFSADQGRPAPHRCLQAVKMASARILSSDPEKFIAEVSPALRSSLSTAVQSIHLDLLLQQPDDPKLSAIVHECLFDVRLYQATGLLHWLEVALRQHWPGFSRDEREIVLRHIDAVADADSGIGDYRRAQLLATLPLTDLPLPHMRAVAASRLVNSYHPTVHPHLAPDYVLREASSDGDDDIDMEQVKGWPPEFDIEALRVLSNAGRRLSDNKVSPEQVQNHLPRAVAAAQTLLPAIERHRDLLDDGNRFWVWYALQASVEKTHFDKVPDFVPPDDFLLACSRLALESIEKEPESLRGWVPPTEGVYFEPTSSWLRALHLADAVLVWPRLQRDASLQLRFEQVLRKAFASGNSSIQISVTTAIRPYHWLRDASRRQLQDELIWNGAVSSQVLAWSVQRLGYESDARRTQIIRLLLNRGDVEDGAESLAGSLGNWIGRLAMYFLSAGKRTTTGALLDDVLASPDRWPALGKVDARKRFLRSAAFGMKEVAKEQWMNVGLATDFARWNFLIWQHIQSLQAKQREANHVILFALHWLQRDPREETGEIVPRDSPMLRVWWEHLMPFWRAVMERGNRPDVFQLLFDLRPSQLSHVVRSEEVFELVEILLNRVATILISGVTNLTQTDPENDDHHSWGENLSYAASAVDALREDGLLCTDLQRERAYSLLRRLADAPFQSLQALAALHHLQADQT